MEITNATCDGTRDTSSHIVWVLTRLQEERSAGLLLIQGPTYSRLETRMINQSVLNALTFQEV